MCGIAGYINKSKEILACNEKIKSMTDAIKHRGPDAEGQWVCENIALGHRRLAIIDLDAKSNQPMVSHDGRFVITFNGEIYNYLELKEELKSKGVIFKTNSDTEVIMEAYRIYGTECFNMFNGMWAFCLYDIENNKRIVKDYELFGLAYVLNIDVNDLLKDMYKNFKK